VPRPNEIDLSHHLPDHQSDAVIPGLHQPVAIHRDAWSIPHVRAQNRNDAFAGLGFAHAQDRLFQMEALLRRGTGRYAEWLGARALPGDVLARQLNTEAASKRDFAVLGVEAREMLQAYARGVNAFIAQERWGVEYAILETAPAPWEPWHSIATMRQIGFLMGSVWWKLWRAAALPIVGIERIAALRFDDGGDDFLCIPTGATATRLVAALADLKPGVEALLGAREDAVGAELEGGSNNWAVSPARTATGRPIVAGDPHRQLEMPNMYAQAHLCCDEFDVIGLTVPGVPGFPHFGHNANVAWGVTHAFVDIHDLYVERFAPGGATYRFRDEMLPATHRRERIAVRGAEASEITVTETHHGPIIAGNPADGSALALRSTQFAIEDRSFDCLLRMLRARTVTELYEATRGWGLIDHNLVAGDTSGTIGHRVRALVPRRPRANGWLPVPGWTGEHEWDGMIPFEAMPCTINPADGLIVTANNRVVASGIEPYLSTDSMPPHRARRILMRLRGLKSPAPDDMAAIHRDKVSIPGVELREKLRAITPPPGAEKVHQLILAWNGEMDAVSHGAAAYAVLHFELTQLVMQQTGLQNAAASPYTKVAPGIVPENQFRSTVAQLLRANDAALLAGESWDSLLAQALSAAAAKLPDKSWGALHTPKLKHQLSLEYPEHAALLDRDCAELSGDNDTVFASGYAAKAGWQATSSALSRYVFDVGNWDNCRWIVFHGVSGHPGSDAYLNQNAIWARGEMVPMVYDWEKLATMPGQRLVAA
jgi:penicillin G amidase